MRNSGLMFLKTSKTILFSRFMFLRRRSYRISRSNRFGISKGSDTVLGYSSDMVFYQIVSYKDIKKLMSNLKNVYQAINEEEALNNLMKFKEAWGKTYPSCVKSWEENWDILSTFFAYPAQVRRIIYTTNIIEGLNRQFRSITKTKPSFVNDYSLRKMLYLASKQILYHQ